MADAWQTVPSPEGQMAQAHYDHRVELRVTSIGTERYEVALVRRKGIRMARGTPDVYVAVVRGLEKAAETVRWIKSNIQSLLAGDDPEEADVATEREVARE